MKNLIHIQIKRKFIFLTIGLGFLIQLSTSAQQWKTEAWNRIDSIRKSEISFTLVSESGIPLVGAKVEVKLKKHDFIFEHSVCSIVRFNIDII